ncbi:TadE/TadG family type IV pilus assembly protein [Sinisalibacter aestuarii]|uniref:Pilus assembly protein n=1 Tax=Sinisalibacter aestuarii TaxID=2949426 RepID=A0ABQ5LUP6_9RHOB|nr:hypothetical protein [Sinisalibacter aestuarii]GKY88707.1 hypothetical protein STA1M1_25760 [Sinisalibacter aestuarii]
MTISHMIRRALAPVSAAARRFGRDERASMSVEAVLVAPMLFWAFLATYAYFDVYRVKNLALKANYAVSDLLSRELNTIDMDYITGARNLYRYLTRADDTSWIRVTVVHCSLNCAVSPDATDEDRELSVDWSRGTDDQPAISDENLMIYYDDIIPMIASGERVIIVETTMDYQPVFAPELTGIGDQTFRDVVMTRPRFAPQLCFDGIGCGAS